MASAKIQSTKNYRLFKNNTQDNRPLDMAKHKLLERSMAKWGFLECFPIVCRRDESGSLVVWDGQHRLAIAEQLGLPVHWVEDKSGFDVAEINCTAKIWTVADYARKWAANDLPDYQEGLAFAQNYGLPCSLAFAMLAGTTSFGNIGQSVRDGTFKVKDRPWAEAVATLYVRSLALAGCLRGTRYLDVCMMVCRVPEFAAARFLQNAERSREKLVPYATRDAYLTMMEDVYNYGRKQLVGLKAAAMMAMRERDVRTNPNQGKKPGRSGADAA